MSSESPANFGVPRLVAHTVTTSHSTAMSGSRWPDTYQTLDSEPLTCIQFNRRGTMLAAGTRSGAVLIWDFDTRSVAATLLGGHFRSVSSVCWSANGHCIISAAADGSVTLWSLDRKCVLHRFDTACPVLSAAVHPQNVHIALVSFAAQTDAHEPVLIDMRTGDLCTLAFSTLIAASAEIVDERKPEYFTAAAIDASGARLVVGSSRGTLLVLDGMSLQPLQRLRLGGERVGAAVRELRFADSSVLLVSSADRIVRSVDVQSTAVREYQDVINRRSWIRIFSPSNDLVAALHSDPSEHAIYMWHRELGHLVKTYEDKQEGLVDMCWHPHRPLFVSVLRASGRLRICSTVFRENFAAFAPDFVELEDNEEYIEREDEFDEGVMLGSEIRRVMHQPPLTQALREVAHVDINSAIEFAVPALSSELPAQWAGASSLIKALNDNSQSADPLPELVYVRAELGANADGVASDSADDVFMVDSDETPPDESVPESVQKSTEAPPSVPTGFGSADTSVVIALGLDPTASRRAPFVPLPPFKSSRSTFNAKKRAYAQVLAVVTAEVTAAQNLEAAKRAAIGRAQALAKRRTSKPVEPFPIDEWLAGQPMPEQLDRVRVAFKRSGVKPMTVAAGAVEVAINAEHVQTVIAEAHATDIAGDVAGTSSINEQSVSLSALADHDS